MLEFKYIKNKYWQAFVLSFILALLLLLPISLRDAIQGNVFHYAGDYNSQSLLFWQYANKFIKSGGTFSWVTELGSGFVNSYSYYMYRIFIDMGSNDKLEFSIGKFHCKLAAQLMGSLRRDSIVRGKGLNQVVGKISLLFRTCISCFACH